MNIFILDYHPVAAAKLQCDKHIVKMVLESAQMLSTAHRILDGTESKIRSKSGKTTVKHWIHPRLDNFLYKAVHVGHPCTVWTMESDANYRWHYKNFVALCDEYTYRYGKVHSTDTQLREMLRACPKNIPTDIGLTPFKLAMGAAPECINPIDPVGSYRAFYQTKQERFSMVWTKRDIPEWFKVAA